MSRLANESCTVSSERVSVVIPTWNCERYIAQTLDSVLAQSWKQLQVIVVDDGSSDRTPHIVAGYGDAVTLVTQRNQGVCVARNRGFEMSDGDFVCFLDHDDYWFAWKLERQVETFRRQPQVGVVFSGFALWLPGPDGHPAPDTLADDGDAAADPLASDPDYSGWIYHQFLIDCWALTSTAMIRRELFAASGGFDASLAYSEDWDLWLRLSRSAPFVKLRSVSTLYRQHPEQGNRRLREIDYRTRLLEEAHARWGLASPDGRKIEPQVFRRNLARYHMQFGLHHLEHGARAVALRSFARAWLLHPGRLRYGALIGATLAGWRPRTASVG